MEVSSRALPGSRSRRPITGPLRAILDPPTRTGCSSPPAAIEGWRRLRRATTLAVLALLAASLGHDTGPARFVLKPVAFSELQGWNEDSLSAVVPAFLKSCVRFLPRQDAAPLDARSSVADYGRVGGWRALCEAAAALPPADDAAARRFFETSFTPLAVADYGASEGLFTGYYEIELNGSRQRHGRYQTPIYR